MRVGICLPIGERGPERIAKSYREMRELAVAADQNGADSIWVADHIFYAPDGVDVTDDGRGVIGIWESMTMLSALADATSRAELGPLVMCTPFRNPGLIAWMANAIDEISGGRFVMGLGAGWHQPEFDAFRFNFDRRVSVFADSLEVIVPLLREGRVDYDGEFAGGHAELRPRGPRPNGPPILIAGTKPRMMALTARWADRWNSVWYGMPTDQFRQERADLIAACEQIGRDPASIEVSAGLAVSSRDDRDDEALGGTVDQIAEGLHAWQEEGVTEVMCRMDPPTVELVERVMEAAQQVR
jgi:alkanesulfonate monooxygenase SsuD/methylene tetrahydromethanopterin reductase-like flavin-dependent oxidoreductase (luciferase family)